MGIVAKQSIRGTIVSYVGILIGFLTTFFVLTRLLTAEEIGLTRVLVDASVLFIGLAQLGSSSSILRFYPYFSGSNQHGFFFWTIVVPLFGFVVIGALYVVLKEPISGWFAEKSPLFVEYYYMVLPLSFAMLYQTIFETNANVLMRIVFPRFVREVLIRVLLLISYVLYAYRYIDLTGLVWALCATYFVAAVANVVYVLSEVMRLKDVEHGSLFKPDIKYIKEHKDIVRQYLYYAGFLLLSALASVLAPSLSSFFVTSQMGLSFTGIFAIATYMAVVVSVPYRSLNAIVSPQLAKAIKEDNSAEVQSLQKMVANTLFLVGSIILLLIWLNIDLIFKVLPNGEEYAVAKYVVLMLSVSQLLLATFNISLTTLNFSKYYYLSLIFSLMLTIGSLLLNNWLVPLYGIEGAAMANVVGYGCYFMLIVLTVGLLMKISPLSIQMLKTLSLFACVMAINWWWTSSWQVGNLWVDSVLRTILLMGFFVVAAYKWNISAWANEMINKYLKRGK